MTDDDGYCKIYASASAAVVVERLSEGCELVFKHSEGNSAAGTVYVLRNGNQAPGEPLDFLHWPTTIDIEPEIRTPDSDAFVVSVLETLWSNQIGAVAACDYEDELPQGGRGFF